LIVLILFLWVACLLVMTANLISLISKQLDLISAENVRAVGPDAVLAMGNESLFVATGHSGIMKWRGQVCDGPTCPVMPTIALALSSEILLKYSFYMLIYERYMHWFTEYQKVGSSPTRIKVIKDEISLEAFQAACNTASAVAFDLETKSFDELEPDAFIVCAAFTLPMTGKCLAGRYLLSTGLHHVIQTGTVFFAVSHLLREIACSSCP
jgi:hypothetical protein